MKTPSPTPAIVSFTPSAGDLAARIASDTGGELYPCGADATYDSEIVAELFVAGRPIVGICAAGILVRLLAPLLDDKFEEPPVLAVSLDAQHVVPLLGGHRGANEMARTIASLIGGKAAVTTASDTRFTRALDVPPPGFVLAHRAPVKSAMAWVLAGKSISLSGHMPWLTEAGYPLSDEGEIALVCSEKLAKPGILTYHPKTLVAGMGCARGTDGAHLIELLDAVLAEAGLARESLAAIATIDIKSDEAGLHALAAHFGVPLRLFSASELALERDRVPNPSSVVEAEIGTPSVAEAAALKAGKLRVSKQKTQQATCAIGLSPHPLDVGAFGAAPGQLHLVGIGPGAPLHRTASAVMALQNASDWVGYGLYLDLIEDLERGQEQHRFELGDEEKRVRYALELAAKGKKVALVCSGDAQIFAMAALVFELLDQDGSRALSDAARRVAVESHPGISALQMASARAGALLGHDFCAISLSDLLTPRETVEKRLAAAARGDFVAAFYNPRSRRRTDLLDYAKALFLQHRPADCPVIIASNLGRAGENVQVVRLEDFDPAQVDMLTIVLFGSSQSASFLRGDGKIAAYTPRGYANKNVST